MAQDNQHLKKWKEIHAIPSEIIDTTDGRTDWRTTRFYELCWHSQTELKSEMHMTLEWHWTLNCRKCLVYSEYVPPRPTFSSVSCYKQPFSRYKVVENQKCTELPQAALEHLTVTSTLYTFNTYPEAQISLRFALWYGFDFSLWHNRESEISF